MKVYRRDVGDRVYLMVCIDGCEPAHISLDEARDLVVMLQNRIGEVEKQQALESFLAKLEKLSPSQIRRLFGAGGIK